MERGLAVVLPSIGLYYDIVNVVPTDFQLFADDCVCYWEINGVSDCHKLQDDIITEDSVLIFFHKFIVHFKLRNTLHYRLPMPGSKINNTQVITTLACNIIRLICLANLLYPGIDFFHHLKIQNCMYSTCNQ